MIYDSTEPERIESLTQNFVIFSENLVFRVFI